MDERLLNAGDFLERDLDPHIPAGNHDAVRYLDDFIDVIDALRVFDFGDNADGMVVVELKLLADLQNIVRTAGEGRGDEVGFHFAGKGHILPVAVAHERH